MDELQSSCVSESLFKELKADILKNETLPMRLDKFVEIDIQTTIGRINIINVQQYNKQTKEEEEEYFNKSITTAEVPDDKNIDGMEIEDDTAASKSCDLTTIKESEEVENWRGLAESRQPKKRKTTKPNYLDPDPTILMVAVHH